MKVKLKILLTRLHLLISFVVIFGFITARFSAYLANTLADFTTDGIGEYFQITIIFIPIFATVYQWVMYKNYSKVFDRYYGMLFLWIAFAVIIIFFVPFGSDDFDYDGNPGHMAGSCWPFIYFVGSLGSDCKYDVVNYFWDITLAIPYFIINIPAIGIRMTTYFHDDAIWWLLISMPAVFGICVGYFYLENKNWVVAGVLLSAVVAQITLLSLGL